MSGIERLRVIQRSNQNILSSIAAARKLGNVNNGIAMDSTSNHQAEIKCENDFNCNENVTEEVPLAFSPAESNKGNGQICAALPMHHSSISSFMQESSEFQWCMDYGCSREFMKSYDEHPTSIFSFDDTQTSYDDLSKNIDANLAEIDMETFCSEDINSILSLPAIYGESFTSVTDDMQNTSESCSSNGKMETISHSMSEESSETSLYKNEPLFSPVKEPEIRLGTISTDSLDFSSLEKQDINLTCQAQKNNYMIAFEASATQLSDDSHASGGKGYLETAARGSMIQSDIGFTTWSKVQKVTKKGLCQVQHIVSSNKSTSLPSLSTREVLISATYKFPSPTGSVLLYNVKNNQIISSPDSSNCSPRSLSLLKLYMLQNYTSNLSSSESLCESSSSSLLQLKQDSKPSLCRNDQYHGIIHKESVQTTEQTDQSQEMFDSNSNGGVNENSTCNLTLRTSFDNVENNNNICELSENNNVGISKQTNEYEIDNSLYFEDSLMEVTPPKTKLSYASPIKEEEEPFEFSSGDETMKDSKDFFLSESGDSEGGIQKINKICENQFAKLNDLKYTKISNISSGEKCSSSKNPSHYPQSQNSVNYTNENNSQSTQTKFLNQRSTEDMLHNTCFSKFVSDNTFCKVKVESQTTCSLMNHSCTKIQKSDSSKLGQLPASKKLNVVITKTCHNSTQIPVHIKDKAIQTSFIEDNNWKTVKRDLEEPTSSKCDLSNDRSKGSPECKPFYIYYPNYSLPDLSFLKSSHNTGDKVGGTQFPVKKKISCGEKALLKRRARSSEGRCRPKSYTCEGGCPINRIEDWASLSILLPENVKGIIRASKERNKLRADSNIGLLNEPARNTHRERPPPLPKRSLSLGQKMPDYLPHSHQYKSVNCIGKQCQSEEYKNVVKTNSKRWSLQEPLYQYVAHQNVRLTSSDDQANQGIFHQLHHSQNQNHLPNMKSNVSPHHCCHLEHVCQEHVHCVHDHNCSCNHCQEYKNLSIHSEKNSELCQQQCTSSSSNKLKNLTKESEEFSESCLSSSEFPPQEFIVSPPRCASPPDEGIPPVNIEKAIWMKLVNTKADILQRLQETVKNIISSASECKEFSLQEMNIGENHIVLFCQVIFQIFSDGLNASVPELLDCVSDCIWQVVQASVMHDCLTKAFKTLVQEVCEQPFTQSALRFYGFVIGLMNMGWIDSWLRQFFSCVKTVRQFYRPTSLLYLLTFPLAEDLRNQLLDIVRPLSLMSFNIELTSMLQLILAHGKNDKPICADIKNNCTFSPADQQSAEKNQEVTWSGTTVYPFSHDYLPDEEKKLQSQAFEDNVESKACDTIAHNHAAPNRKTKPLKDVTVEKALLVDPCADSGCSSEIFHHASKEEFPRFQQLRQRWEKLACLEDTASVTKPSTSNKPVNLKALENSYTNDADFNKASKIVVNKYSKIIANTETLENTAANITCGRRRSMIPIHKGIKAIGNRRSGSAPAERGQR